MCPAEGSKNRKAIPIRQVVNAAAILYPPAQARNLLKYQNDSLLDEGIHENISGDLQDGAIFDRQDCLVAAILFGFKACHHGEPNTDP